MSVFVDGGRVPRLAWWVTLVLALVVALAGAGLAYGTHAYANEHDGRLLPGATVGGVDVGGMTAQEAVAAVDAVTAPQLDRTVTLRWGQHRWTTTPRALGATTDTQAAVDEAMDASQAPPLSALARMRWLGESFTFDRDVAITYPEGAARAYVDQVAAELDVAPRDATLEIVGDTFEVVPEQTGQALDADAAATALRAALDSGGDPASGGDQVELTVQPVHPEVATAAFRQVLLLRQGEHTLDLYEDGQLTRTWNVAVGESGHRTPTGVYHVTRKRHMPTWVNPSPNGWGSGMPERIGPGVNNPLGVRALNWNAPAIRFHGTAKESSIGTDASKGCVRLTNSDVVELYDLVDVGATIVSIG